MKGIRGRITATALAMLASITSAALPAEASTPGPARPAAVAEPVVPSTPAAARAAAREAARDLPGVCGPPYAEGRAALGPAVLPRAGYFGAMMRGYIRYGGLTPAKFTFRYRDETTNPPGWRYPPDLGFAHAGGWSNGRVLRHRTTLGAGALTDRFGSPFGTFLAPAGTRYGTRALPPDSLNTRSGDPAHLCNYHLYRVVRPFDVDAGPIARAFQQPGGGLQYLLMATYLPGAPQTVNVQWLIDNGYVTVVY
jgi:Tuberculosis necrotizing toxin